MPTADTFDAAARSFEQAAEELDLLLHSTPSHFGPDTLWGGLLTMVADLTVSTSTATVSTTASALAEYAATCRRRASTCRAFAAEMAIHEEELRRYESALARFDPFDLEAAPLRRPSRPSRLFSWIEV